MNIQDTDIAIIGAGAAGLATAIFAAEANPTLSISLLDGAKTIGAKILVSGGGRCNVTNVKVVPADFHAPRPLVQRILKRFDERKTVDWFASLGVPLKEEPLGKLFPTSNTAKTVLQALLRRCDALQVPVLSNHRVQGITTRKDYFQISHTQGSVHCRKLIMATGGRSLPKSGSDGQGWGVAQHLGHTVTPTFPALVPLVLEESCFHAELSGTSHDVAVTTWVEGKLIDRCRGSLLWTHFGMSGPVVLDASRFWVMAQAQGKQASVTLSFFPDETFESLDVRLLETARLFGKRSVESILSDQLPGRVVKALCASCDGQVKRDSQKTQNGISGKPLGTTAVSQLSRSSRRDLANILTQFPVPVLRARGWNFAEVTAGGVPLQEVNVSTMESRKVPGLYLVGEMLDCDGRIGGFNFQWAWSTGFIAGIAAAKGEDSGFHG